MSKILIIALGLFAAQTFSQTSTDFPVRYVNGYRPATDSLFASTSGSWVFQNARIYVYAGTSDLSPVTTSFTSPNMQMIQHTYAYNASGNVVQHQTLDGGYLIEQEKRTYSNNLLIRILITSYNRDFTTHAILDSTPSQDSLFYNAQNQCTLHAKYMWDSGAWIRYQTLGYTFVAGRNDTLTETFSQAASLTNLTLSVIRIVTSSYNSDNTVSEQRAEYPAYPSMKPSKLLYTYANNRLASILSNEESTPGIYTVTGRTLYTYNSSQQLVRKVIQNATFANTRAYVYTIDNAGNVLGETDSATTGLVGKTTYSYEAITPTANKNQSMHAPSITASLQFNNHSGNVTYIHKETLGSTATLEIRTVQGKLVAVLSPSSILDGIAYFNVKEKVASSGMYIVSVRSGTRIHAVAKTTICQ